MMLWKTYMWKKLYHCQGLHPFWYSAFKLRLNSVQWAPRRICPASVTIQPMQMWCKLIPVLQYFPRKWKRVTDRTCCHVKLQSTFKRPYKKLCKSPWLHLWAATDQIKANAILAVLQRGTLHRQIILGLGFKLSPGWGHAQDHSKCENRTWREPPHFQPRWKLTIRRNGDWWCILYFLHSTDQEQVSSWDHAFAKHVTELCTGTTVKHRLLI